LLAPPPGHLRTDRGGLPPHPLEREVEGVAAMVHGNAAAAESPLAPPVRTPFRNAASKRVSEGVEGDGPNGPDSTGLDDIPDRLDHRRMLVIVARENHSMDGGGSLQEQRRLADGGGKRLLAKDVKAALQRSASDLRMRRGRSADVDKVEPVRLGI